MITDSNLRIYLDEYMSTRDPRTISAADALQALQEKTEVRVQDVEREIVLYMAQLHVHASRGIRVNGPPTSYATERDNIYESFDAKWQHKNKLDGEIKTALEDMISNLNSEGKEFKRLRRCNVQQDPKVLSNAMVRFFGTGETEMLPSRANERVWLYITQNNLDHDLDVKCDWKLEKLFGRGSFTKDDIPRLVEEHLSVA